MQDQYIKTTYIVVINIFFGVKDMGDGAHIVDKDNSWYRNILYIEFVYIIMGSLGIGMAIISAINVTID